MPTPNVPTALLTPQGRFLYDLFLYNPPRATAKLDRTGSGHGSDVDASVLDECLETFIKYRLRSKVEIDNVTNDFSCWQRYGSGPTEKSSDVEEPEAASVGWGAGVDAAAMSALRGGSLGWQWFKDPRLAYLGFRGIFPSNIIPPLIEADKETDEDNYLLWRIEKGVAEGSTEMPKGCKKGSVLVWGDGDVVAVRCGELGTNYNLFGLMKSDELKTEDTRHRGAETKFERKTFVFCIIIISSVPKEECKHHYLLFIFQCRWDHCSVVFLCHISGYRFGEECLNKVL